MKQLRRTIRRILLENQSHYEKLASLLTGKMNRDERVTVNSVEQATELGDALGCITVNEREPSPTGYRVYYELVLSDAFFTVAKPYLTDMKARLLDDCEIYDAERMVRFVCTDL